MYSNHELMYQLQKFEDQFNQISPSTVTSPMYHAGYRNHSIVGPYYYLIQIDKKQSIQTMMTIIQRTGHLEYGLNLNSDQQHQIEHFAQKLEHHHMFGLSNIRRPSIELHPGYNGYPPDVLHP